MGVLLFLVFDTCMVAADLIVDVDPVAYFFAGIAISALGGSLLFAAIARLGTWGLSTAAPRNRRDEWIRKEANGNAEYFNDVIISIRCHPVAHQARPNRPGADVGERGALPFRHPPYSGA